MSRSLSPRLAALALALPLACAGAPGAARLPGAVLAALEARVSAVRERPFRAHVRGLSVPQSSVPGLLSAELDRVVSEQEMAREASLASALGLLPAGVDLRAAALRFQSDSIAGFYSQSERRLFVVA